MIIMMETHFQEDFTHDRLPLPIGVAHTSRSNDKPSTQPNILAKVAQAMKIMIAYLYR